MSLVVETGRTTPPLGFHPIHDGESLLGVLAHTIARLNDAWRDLRRPIQLHSECRGAARRQVRWWAGKACETLRQFCDTLPTSPGEGDPDLPLPDPDACLLPPCCQPPKCHNGNGKKVKRRR